MNYKWIGAIFIMVSCGGCGFLMAGHHLSKVKLLQNFISILDYMECELQYRCTPLPQLCRQAGQVGSGKLRSVFLLLADELEAQISPDAARCMAAVLDKMGDLDSTLFGILTEFGARLGRFDMSGQLRGLEFTRVLCREKLDKLTQNQDNRMRSYQTLGLCAGAAVAILFI